MAMQRLVRSSQKMTQIGALVVLQMQQVFRIPQLALSKMAIYVYASTYAYVDKRR